MCIYYKNEQNLIYKSREHIFPATLGGIETLPLGYVSNKANEYFSKLESNIITSSFLGLSKSFFGPGKRGKNTPGRLPISLISEENKEYLGYIFYAKPHQITQIIIKNDPKEILISRDFYYNSQNDTEILLKRINEYNGKYTYIESNLKYSNFIIGVYEGRLYITAKNKDKINTYIDYIKMYVNTIDYSKEQHGIINKPKKEIHMEVSMANDARVFAKTSVNVIAKIKGAEYLSKSCFDKYINWIMGEDNSEFEQLPQNKRILPIQLENSHMHYCVLMNIDNIFIAFVTFYHYWTMAFQICKSFDNFFNNTYILFCDWENKKEFTLQELIDSKFLE